MAGFAWLALRQAQEAMKHGRLEEAARLMNQPGAQDQHGAAALMVKLARAFAARGERSLRKDDPEAAWRDLLQAEHVHTPEKGGERLRDALTRLGVAEVRALPGTILFCFAILLSMLAGVFVDLRTVEQMNEA